MTVTQSDSLFNSDFVGPMFYAIVVRACNAIDVRLVALIALRLPLRCDC